MSEGVMLRLRDVANGGLFCDGDWVESKDQDPNGTIRLLQLADIGDGEFRNKSSRWLRPDQAERIGVTYVQEGDILIARMPDPLGRACIVPKLETPSITAVDVAILRVKPEDVDPRWLMWWLNSPQTRATIAALASGTTRQRITRKNLEALDLFLPPLDEQRRIVETLDEHLARLDKALVEVRSALLKFETLERSAMAMHFTTSESSEIVNLTKISDVTEKAKSIDPKTLGSDSFRYVDIGSISPDSEAPNVLEWTPSAAAPSRARQHIKLGDVVFSTVRPYQKKIAIVKEDLDGHIASTGFCVLRPLPGVLDTRYLYHYLKSDALMDQVLPLQRGASYPAVGDSDVKNATIPVPDLDTQKAIAEQLDSVVGIVKSLKSQLQDISVTAVTMRISILHSAFSGTLQEEK